MPKLQAQHRQRTVWRSRGTAPRRPCVADGQAALEIVGPEMERTTQRLAFFRAGNDFSAMLANGAQRPDGAVLAAHHQNRLAGDLGRHAVAGCPTCSTGQRKSTCARTLPSARNRRTPARCSSRPASSDASPPPRRDQRPPPAMSSTTGDRNFQGLMVKVSMDPSRPPGAASRLPLACMSHHNSQDCRMGSCMRKVPSKPKETSPAVPSLLPDRLPPAPASCRRRTTRRRRSR